MVIDHEIDPSSWNESLERIDVANDRGQFNGVFTLVESQGEVAISHQVGLHVNERS